MSVAVAQAMRYAGCPNRRSLGVSDVFPLVTPRQAVWGAADCGNAAAPPLHTDTDCPDAHTHWH